jgi:hypothetical protein
MKFSNISLWFDSTPVDFNVIGEWVSVFMLLIVVCVWLLSDRRASRWVGTVSNNLLVVSAVIWVLGVLVYLVGFYRPELNWLSVIPGAVIAAFKMFVVSNDLSRVSKVMQEDVLYMSMFSLVHFAAAFVTFLFIFKMIGYKIKSSLNVLMHKWFKAEGKTVHLFWGINEASCLMAEDIRKNHADATIIFVDIDEDSDDASQKKASLSHITNTITISSSEIARLDAVEALVDHCYNGPSAFNTDGEMDIFGALHLRNIAAIVQKSSRSYFYFLSDDEAQNIAGALNLQQDSLLRSMTENRPVIYVHARRNTNNSVLDHYSQYVGDQSRMEIQIVDSAYLSVATLKRNETALPVRCVEVDKATGAVDTPFTSLIVGFGDTGLEAFRFLYEYSAFVGSDGKKSPFKCYAVDERMDRIEGFVRERMPAIGEEELSLIKASVDSEKFWTKINGIIRDLNYVVIALNNDSVGLSLAVNLFKSALKNRPSGLPLLKIMVRCYGSVSEKRMSEVAHSLNMSIEEGKVEICLFGKEEDLYRCSTILSDAVLSEAKEFNRVYEESSMTSDQQWQKNFGPAEIERLMTKKGMSRYHAIYDIHRRIAQNISNSLHRSTKMMLMGFDAEEQPERLKLYKTYVDSRKFGQITYECPQTDASLLLNLAKVEHERWVASHKLMGYTYGPKNDCVRKQHPCVCPWEDLDEMTQSYDCNVVDTTIKLA